jgi:hypothetical protein
MKMKHKKRKKGHKPFDLFSIKPVGPLQRPFSLPKTRADAVMLMVKGCDTPIASGGMVVPILVSHEQVQACTDLLRQGDHPLRPLLCGIIRAWLQLHS